MSRSAIAELENFLSARSSTRQWPRLIAQKSTSTEENAVELDLQIDPDLVYFAGHFPGQPVLPGVVQVHWAGEFAKTLFNTDEFSSLLGMKFNNMVLPDTTIKLLLKFDPDKSRVRFSYVNADSKYSMGTLVFLQVKP